MEGMQWLMSAHVWHALNVYLLPLLPLPLLPLLFQSLKGYLGCVKEVWRRVEGT